MERRASASSATPLPLYATPNSTVTLSRRSRGRLSGGSHRHHRSSSSTGSFGLPMDGDSLFHALKRSPVAFLTFFTPTHLTARARTTNLAVFLLVLTCIASLVYNVKFYLHEHPLKGERDRLPLSIRATLPRNNVPPLQAAAPKGMGKDNHQKGHQDVLDAHSVDGDHATQAASGASWLNSAASTENVNFASLDHLIMVPGHAVWRGRKASEIVQDENWVLEVMQKGGSIRTFVKHIIKGVELALQDSSSLLVFSGGQTRTIAQETEGDSYFRISNALNLYDPSNSLIPPEIAGVPGAPLKDGSNSNSTDTTDAKAHSDALTQDDSHKSGTSVFFPRATTEQFAMDSYQNLLFSLCRFKEVTGRYPSRVTVVGFGMKRSRFTDVHRAALKFPLSSFTYVGIDDEGETGQSYLGEKEYGLKPYSADLYGCHGILLLKRRGRNPFRRIHPYFTSNKNLENLLEYCPDNPTAVYPDRLPWEIDE